MNIEPIPRAPLGDLNTLAVTATADYLLTIDDAAQIPAAVDFARSRGLPLMVLGQGSNVVFGGDYAGLVLRMMTSGTTVKESGSDVLLEVAAGENWHQLVMNCLDRGYYGLENLALIPGTVGAAPVQNIGAYGVELESVLESVSGWHIDRGEWQLLSRQQCEFGYRDSVFKHALKDRFIISAVTLRLRTEADTHTDYQALRDYLQAHALDAADPRAVAAAVIAIRQSKLPDPAAIPNAGSFFKNPVVSRQQYEQLLQRYPDLVAYPLANDRFKLAAGWLLDRAGWKGKQRNGVGFFAEQALVMINPGHRAGAELMALAEDVRRDIQQQFGVELDIEPRVY